MALPENIFHQVGSIKICASLFQHIRMRSMGNTAESKKVKLKFQFRNFNLLKGETVEEMTTRFNYLIADLDKMRLETSVIDKIDTIKSALPSSYSTFLMVLKENNYFNNEDLTASEFMQEIEAREYDLKCQNSSKDIQDPAFFGGSMPLSSTISPITAFLTQNASENATTMYSDPRACFYTAGNTGFSSASGSSGGSGSSSPTNQFSSQTNVNMREAEQNFAFLSAFMTSYENLVSSKIATSDLTDEDYDHINPDDLELMDLKWNMAMIVKKVKKFMQRTGKDLPYLNKKLGFNKLKVKCDNC
ncbi:uncharacterized protein LOC143553540 [Bidens hawaiensis]|uniref:uncharacterized protein LOC143553540 n=1 Tax=Bidens hawaiensis TaxID=980011 RepID=UPI0040496CFB